MEIGYLQNKCAERQVEWGMPDAPLSFRAMEVAGEVGELLNVIKKIERERMGFKGSRANYDQLDDELADVMICLANLANQLGRDLEDSVLMKFNADSKKHGFKTRLEI